MKIFFWKNINEINISLLLILLVGVLLWGIFISGKITSQKHFIECINIMSIAKTPADTLKLIKTVPYCSNVWISERDSIK